MTPDQHAHLDKITEDFTSALRTKYIRGQAEHGGNLWDRGCVNELGDEIVDLVTYYHCIKYNLAQIQKEITFAREHVSKGDYRSLQETLDAIYQLSKP